MRESFRRHRAPPVRRCRRSTRRSPARRAGRGRRRAGRGVRHRRRVLHRRDGLPAPGARRVPDAARPRVVRHRLRGRGRRRPGLDRPAGHRRHHARLRRCRALPERAAARLRGPLRDRHPRRVARRAGRAAGRPGHRAARAAGHASTTTAGALVEPGGNALRAVRAAALAPGDRVLVLGPGTIGLLVAAVRPGPRRGGPPLGLSPAVARLRPHARVRTAPGPPTDLPDAAVRRRHRRLQRARPAGARPRPGRAGQAGGLHRPGRHARA